jgi:hypothetical protein
VHAGFASNVMPNTPQVDTPYSRPLIKEVVMTFFFLIVILGATHARS